MCQGSSGSLVCRICLQACSADCMSLFESYKGTSLAEHLVLIVDLKIVKDDGYPDHICKICLVDFETAISFKTRCETSNKILREEYTNSLNAKLTVKEEIKHEEPEYLGKEPSFDDSDFETLHADIAVKIEISKPLDEVQCHDCGNMFKSKCKLRVHWKKEHMLNLQTCQLCKRVFKSFSAYKRHEKIIERKPCVNTKYVTVKGTGRNRVYQCIKCEYNTKRLQAMRYHTAIHSGLKKHICNICSKAFTQIGSLLGHKENIHKQYRKEITCQYCGKFVQGRNSIYCHLKQHRNEESKIKYQCDICKKFVKSRNSIITHLKRHSDTKSMTCEVCAASFYTSADLANHRRYHHTTKVFTWYKCEVCHYQSHYKHAIKKHKAKHTDTNTCCTKCGKFFDDTTKLEKHLRVHFGERKYACPFCDAKFLHRDGRFKHIRYKHNPQLPKPSRNTKQVKKENN